MYRRWGLETPTVDKQDFLSREEARVVLGKSTYLSYGSLISRRILNPAFLDDGTEGFTRDSVEAEVRWQHEAGPWQRLRRVIGWLGHNLELPL